MNPNQGNWVSPEQSGNYVTPAPVDPKTGGFQSLPLIRGFTAPKKVTRDGQPAKRRGPKPDSKPAQTRRQELNRQAQRTHRERKEQYIKALEIELARLREMHVMEINTFNSTLDSHRMQIHEFLQENMILKDMLASRGIPFEAELENRRAAAAMRVHHDGSVPGSGPLSNRGTPYQGMVSPSQHSAATYSSRGGPRPMNGGSVSAVSGASPSNTHHSHALHGPDISEQAVKQEHEGVPDMPGIFEKEPQLSIDFILALEATCRDHSEYLVRRSADSPNTVEDALFSGHALMATCPPPTHIETTPAQKGGLQPTYPHQAPQIPTENLSKLLNLSQILKVSGEIGGGQVTPIMAIQSLRSHRHYSSLTREDVMGMIDSIRDRVRCYGFGAVMEDFELKDALRNIFATKPEIYEAFGDEYDEDIDDMYS